MGSLGLWLENPVGHWRSLPDHLSWQLVQSPKASSRATKARSTHISIVSLEDISEQDFTAWQGTYDALTGIFELVLSPEEIHEWASDHQGWRIR